MKKNRHQQWLLCILLIVLGIFFQQVQDMFIFFYTFGDNEIAQESPKKITSEFNISGKYISTHTPEEYYHKVISPVIIWPQSSSISEEERRFLQDVNPWGILLKNKNMKSAQEATLLIQEIKTLLGRQDVFFITDSEIGSDLAGIIQNNNAKRAFTYGLNAQKDIEKAKKDMYEQGIHMGKELRKIGFNMIFAPVVDIRRPGKTSNAFYTSGWSGIAEWRFLSDRPEFVDLLAQEFTRGIQEQGVFVVYKHFPGLGSSKTDSHGATPVIKKDLEELSSQEFLPYYHLDKKDVHFVMMGHALVPVLDETFISTFSSKTVKYLKDEIGFDGFVISDALNMGALHEVPFEERMQKSYNAGIDILLPFFGNQTFQEQLGMIHSLNPDRVEEFNKKIKKYSYRFFPEND